MIGEFSDIQIFQHLGKGIPLFMASHKNCLQADYLLGPGPRLIKKNLPGRGLTKVEKHWFRLSGLSEYLLAVLNKIKSAPCLTQLYNILLLFYYWLLVSASNGHHEANIYKKKNLKMLLHIVQKYNFLDLMMAF
jgi:hypothetical protein